MGRKIIYIAYFNLLGEVGSILVGGYSALIFPTTTAQQKYFIIQGQHAVLAY